MRTKIATVPRVVEPNVGDWYVYFSVRDAATGKMIPQKIYRGFKVRKTRKEKLAWGAILVREYTEKLKRGWSPLDDGDKVIYSDALEYANLANKFKRKRQSVKNIRYYLSEYLAGRQQELREKTYSTYRSKLRIFCEWLDDGGFADYDVAEIGCKIVGGFFDFLITDQQLDRRTVDKYRQILRSYFEYMKKAGKITENPVVEIKLPPKSKDMAARPINQSDLSLLIAEIKERDPQLYLVCMFEYYTALRPGQEIRLLKVKDVDVYNHVITVVEGQAKTIRRTVDMPKQLSKLLIEYQVQNYNREFYIFGKFGFPGPVGFGKNNFRNRFNKIRDDLKLPDIYKLYSFKHTGCGRLIESGRTLEEIRDHVGHTSIESTANYVRRHFGMRNRNIIDNFPEP
jgi:integrase